MPKAKILSVQSHIVSGNVGNKIATFVLQLLNFDVDSIFSVNWSNHTAYGCFKGHTANENDLKLVFEGLEQNDLLWYDYVLTGFIKTLDFFQVLYDKILNLKQKNSKTKYLCDPVLGDNNKLYCPPEFIPFYQNKLLKIADIITPNQFEAELLSGLKISSHQDVINVAQKLHLLGPKIVVITSYEIKNGSNIMYCGVSFTDKVEKTFRIDVIDIPKIEQLFVGTGDMFASLLLAYLHPIFDELNQEKLVICIVKAISVLQKVLKYTSEEMQKNKNNTTFESIQSKRISKAADLMMVDCVNFILEEEVDEKTHHHRTLGTFHLSDGPILC